MARKIVLVNGVPGSGKSALACQLAQALEAPVFSKDKVKEALSDSVGHPTVERSLGAVAMETVSHSG